MALESSADALREAQKYLGLAADVEGIAFHVRRLDKSRAAYFLVHTGGQALCLDAETGALMASAETPHLPVTLTSEAAIKRARFGPGATAALVWSPIAVSQSMFDPLWAVTDGDHTLYFDQRGTMWKTLPAKQPGGGSA